VARRFKVVCPTCGKLASHAFECDAEQSAEVHAVAHSEPGVFRFSDPIFDPDHVPTIEPVEVL